MSRQVNTATSSASAGPASDSFASRLHDRLSHTTSEAFAHQVGVTLRTVQRWRSGETEPSAGDLMRISAVLGCQPSDLYPAPGRQAAA